MILILGFEFLIIFNEDLYVSLFLNNLPVTQQPHSEVFTQEKWKLMFLQKPVYQNRYSSFIHSSPKLESPHMPLTWHE